MFSIYNFLSEFFFDVPTFKTAIARSFKIFVLCILMIVICVTFQIPAEYAFVFYVLNFILPCFIFSRYTQQRFRSKHQ